VDRPGRAATVLLTLDWARNHVALWHHDGATIA
jgi:hypothetical protein